MQFIETPIFSRAITEFLTDEQYRVLQAALLLRPKAGATIPRTGGIRKLRWSLPGSGKRGGIRVIYYWDEPSQTTYMLYVFQKNEQEDLTPQQVRMLRKVVREEFG